jgi:uncharacterized protein
MSTNHLIHETSPYLLQHAHNPVDWYPWGIETLDLARKQDKPILLSIGYSACHWCHVMAHESFEDEQVAALMNRHFVNIKVDREERPDLDHIYQTAHAMLTGRSGGWPLTMFLTPEQKPFFSGTYFPKQARYNLPGFAEILPRVAAFYHENAGQIARQSDELAQAITHHLHRAAQGELSDMPLRAAMRELETGFDALHGGFGDAPKFPHPGELDLCLREAARTGNDRTAQMAMYSLECMARGGIYDQLGGGFFRYSVDERWEIPHFEKMLYDNAQLLPLYADAWQLTRNPLFRRVAEETAAWLMREMQSPEGGYYATLDADSEHEEGKFYVWQQDGIRSALEPQEYAVCEAYYGLEGRPNFEAHWHLRESRPIAEVAGQLGYAEETCGKLLQSARSKLLAIRERRARPGRDDKVLTAWNGLMVKGMAHAARIFDRIDWLNSARSAADFIHENLWRDGRLYAVYKDEQVRFNAYLDDYAFMLEAVLELLQAEFRLSDLEWGRAIAEVMLARFKDAAQGDFFFTAHDHEELIFRLKPVHDNATPGGNAAAVRALQRLGHLFGEPRYLEAAELVLRLYYGQMLEQPGGFATLMTALQEYVTPVRLLILVGEKQALDSWRAAVHEIYSPDLICITLTEQNANLPDILDKPYTAMPSAWLCQGTQCLPVMNDLTELCDALRMEQNS